MGHVYIGMAMKIISNGDTSSIENRAIVIIRIVDWTSTETIWLSIVLFMPDSTNC